jgi:hypothetical protein
MSQPPTVRERDCTGRASSQGSANALNAVMLSLLYVAPLALRNSRVPVLERRAFTRRHCCFNLDHRNQAGEQYFVYGLHPKRKDPGNHSK